MAANFISASFLKNVRYFLTRLSSHSKHRHSVNEVWTRDETAGSDIPAPHQISKLKSSNNRMVDSSDTGVGKLTKSLTTELSRTKVDTENETLKKHFQIPKCKLPPAPEMAAIEKFVENAMYSQETRADQTTNKPDPTHAEGYNAMMKALKRPNDPAMIWKVLLALRTAGHGSVLNLLALTNNHAQLLHLVIRFVSTIPPNLDDDVTGDRLQVYKDHSLCDAHFNLLLAIVSARSTHVVPILTAVWKLLTNYGPLEDEEV